jgi:hypothetical protein
LLDEVIERSVLKDHGRVFAPEQAFRYRCMLPAELAQRYREFGFGTDIDLQSLRTRLLR